MMMNNKLMFFDLYFFKSSCNFTIAILIKSALVPCSGAFTAARWANSLIFALIDKTVQKYCNQPIREIFPQ